MARLRVPDSVRPYKGCPDPAHTPVAGIVTAGSSYEVDPTANGPGTEGSSVTWNPTAKYPSIMSTGGSNESSAMKFAGFGSLLPKSATRSYLPAVVGLGHTNASFPLMQLAVVMTSCTAPVTSVRLLSTLHCEAVLCATTEYRTFRPM